MRAEIPVPSLALVGYTNAGKSTLFRALTGADAYVADQLFATLDPTVRRMTLPGGAAVVAADTVGFIRELPHELVAAFQSTLTEAREATLLLHVVDASDPRRDEQIAQVDAVLAEIGASRSRSSSSTTRSTGSASCSRASSATPTAGLRAVWISAEQRLGLDLLLAGGRRAAGALRAPRAAAHPGERRRAALAAVRRAGGARRGNRAGRLIELAVELPDLELLHWRAPPGVQILEVQRRGRALCPRGAYLQSPAAVEREQAAAEPARIPSMAWNQPSGQNKIRGAAAGPGRRRTSMSA